MTKRTNNSETENVDQNQSKAARAAKALDGVTIAFRYLSRCKAQARNRHFSAP